MREFCQKYLLFFETEGDIKLSIHESLAEYRDNPDLKGWISGEDFEDTRPLHEEIASLRNHVERLKKELIIAPPKIGVTSENQFDSIIEYLCTEIVSIPKKLGGPKETPLVEIFLANKEALINGVTNSSGGSDAEIFFYQTLSPKLAVHEIMANEKVPGAAYRRSYVTNKGLQVLAELSKRVRNLAAKKPKLPNPEK